MDLLGFMPELLPDITGHIRMKPHLSRTRRFLDFTIVKMISSMTSFSMISQEMMGLALGALQLEYKLML
jgi:hypothetical protein